MDGLTRTVSPKSSLQSMGLSDEDLEVEFVVCIREPCNDRIVVLKELSWIVSNLSGTIEIDE